MTHSQSDFMHLNKIKIVKVPSIIRIQLQRLKCIHHELETQYRKQLEGDKIIRSVLVQRTAVYKCILIGSQNELLNLFCLIGPIHDANKNKFQISFYCGH